MLIFDEEDETYISDDIEGFLRFFMAVVSGDRNWIIEKMAEYQEGSDRGGYIWGILNPDDEDYNHKEGYVTLLFFYPVEEKDTKVFVEKHLFYERLVTVCGEIIEKEPENKDKIEGYLEQIKVHLKIRR